MAKGKKNLVHFDRQNNCFVGIDPACMEELRKQYPEKDVHMELIKMKNWLLTPKGKDLVGSINFIRNWLSKTFENKPAIEYDTPLRPLLNDYLKDLWKGREHILELNTR
jgi:hypothetical protein